MPTSHKPRKVELTPAQEEAFRGEVENIWNTIIMTVPVPEDSRAKTLYTGAIVLMEQLKFAMLANAQVSVGMLQSIGQQIFDSLSRIESAGVLALEEENPE